MVLVLVLLLSAGPIAMRPAVSTQAVKGDADDPAVWIGPKGQSLLIGTDKKMSVHVFGMDGKTKQIIPAAHPNNVDIEYGFKLGSRQIDIAVATERTARRLRVFAISPSGLKDVTGSTEVFAGEAGERGSCMGIGLYRRPKDGKVFAIVSRKMGPKRGYLWQYELRASPSGKIDAIKIREFGELIGDKEIESLAVDDELGHVYAAEETEGIHQYWADPSKSGERLATFGSTGYNGDREGIGIYTTSKGGGYVVCTEQLKRNSLYHVYTRSSPHMEVAVLAGGADETDGIEVVSTPIDRFSRGIIVAMNSSGKNFLLFEWPETLH